MVKDVRINAHWHTLRDDHKAPGRARRWFSDTDEAQRFLRIATAETGFLNALRHRVRTTERGAALPTCKDALTVSRAASRALDNTLTLSVRPIRQYSNAAQEQTNNASADAAPRRSLESTTPSAMVGPRAKAPPPQERKAPVGPVDVAQQITALLAAAQNGAPFCEQCERARQEAERSARNEDAAQ